MLGECAIMAGSPTGKSFIPVNGTSVGGVYGD